MSSVDSLLTLILSNTYEADVLHHRLELWQSLLKKYLFSDNAESDDPEKALSSALARASSEDNELPEHVEAVEEWIGETRSLSRDEAHDLIENIKKEIEKLPTLTLTLAITLPRHEREKLGVWIRENVNPQALLDLRVSSTMVGGSIMVWNNKEIDKAIRLTRGKSREAIKKALESSGKPNKEPSNTKDDTAVDKGKETTKPKKPNNSKKPAASTPDSKKMP